MECITRVSRIGGRTLNLVAPRYRVIFVSVNPPAIRRLCRDPITYSASPTIAASLPVMSQFCFREPGADRTTSVCVVGPDIPASFPGWFIRIICFFVDKGGIVLKETNRFIPAVNIFYLCLIFCIGLATTQEFRMIDLRQLKKFLSRIVLSYALLI